MQESPVPDPSRSHDVSGLTDAELADQAGPPGVSCPGPTWLASDKSTSLGDPR
jgi:hypothetical protein